LDELIAFTVDLDLAAQFAWFIQRARVQQLNTALSADVE
jgi:hypothetical protein